MATAITQRQEEKKLVEGVQGIVRRALVNGIPCISKSSKGVDFTIELEYAALKKLSSLKNPHFPHLVHYSPRTDHNMTPTIFIREIRGTNVGSDVFEVLQNPKVLPEAKVNLILQTLCVCKIMHDYMDMAHNDLHIGNVLVEPTQSDIIVYKFRDGNNYAFKTYGLRPVIIDFGMASVPSEHWMGTGDMTNLGIFTFYADQYSDVRRLVCTSSGELKDAYLYKTTYYDGSVLPKFFSLSRTALAGLPLRPAGWFKADTFPDMTRVLSKALVDGRVPLIGKNVVVRIDYQRMLSVGPKPNIGVLLPTSTHYYDAIGLFMVPHTEIPPKTVADARDQLNRHGDAAAMEVHHRFRSFVALWLERKSIPQIRPMYDIVADTRRLDLELLRYLIIAAAQPKLRDVDITRARYRALINAFDELTKAVSKFLVLWLNLLRENMRKILSTVKYNTIADVLSLAKSDPISFKPGMVVETQDFERQVLTTTQLSTVDEINALNKLSYSNFSRPAVVKILKPIPIPPLVVRQERTEEPMLVDPYVSPPPREEEDMDIEYL